jgi:F-type H+/Na+-transporting ATPase subunit alpha
MEEFKEYLEKTGEIGEVIGISNFIAKVSGLPNLKLNEMVISERGEKGIVFGLEKNEAEILTFGKNLKVGEKIVRTDRVFQIPVSENLLGRIVDPLLRPIDELGPITGEKEFWEIYREAPAMIFRKRVKKPLNTGVMIVDFLIPIGYGQKELVIGDTKTGKTTFILQTMINQAREGTICIYVAIGKEISAVKFVENYLKEEGVFENVVMIVAFGKDPPTLNYLSPFSGMTVAEYFRDKGKSVLIVFDDLTTHAKFYREISLLAKRLPGRSSYPGDIFHIQAALLERAGNIEGKNGEVSITALPVGETLENDISGYIQTNLIAMTDGHIFFDSEEFRKGKRPAINAFLSVSRVGNQTKNQIEKELAQLIRRNLVEYQRAQTVAQFGVELSLKTRKILEIGRKIEILFEQDPKTLMPYPLRIFLFGLLFNGFFDGKPENLTRLEKEEIIKEYNRGKLKELDEIKELKNFQELKSFVEKMIPEVKEILHLPF